MQVQLDQPTLALSDAPEAALVPGSDVFPIESLFALVAQPSLQPIAPYRPLRDFSLDIAPTYATDFSEVRGQEHVKRALEVAAAGQHNVLTLWTKSHTFQHPNSWATWLESSVAFGTG